MHGYYVIDADGHVGETNKGGWLPRPFLDPAFADRAPEYLGVIRNAVRFRVDGYVYPKYRGKGVGIQGKIRGGSKMIERPAGLVNPEKRLPDMDLDGVDVAVLFRGLACLGAGAFKDPALGAAMA